MPLISLIPQQIKMCVAYIIAKLQLYSCCVKCYPSHHFFLSFFCC